MRDEKLDAVVARSTFRSQNVQNTSASENFWKLSCQKSARPCGAKHIASFCMAGTRDSAPWAKHEGFVAVSQTVAGVGLRGGSAKMHFIISRGRCSTRDIWVTDVRRSGRWFPERGCILEHQIFRFGKMALCDRCSTSYDLASTFRGRRSTLDRWNGLIAKRIGTRPSALHSIFEGSLAELLWFWCCQLRKLRKSRRIAWFLTLSSSNVEEISQTGCVFDAANYKNWRSFAEVLWFWPCQVQNWGSFAGLLRFWCCQVQTLRKSRRIASVSGLQVDRQVDRWTDWQVDR